MVCGDKCRNDNGEDEDKGGRVSVSLRLNLLVSLPFSLYLFARQLPILKEMGRGREQYAGACRKRNAGQAAADNLICTPAIAYSSI